MISATKTKRSKDIIYIIHSLIVLTLIFAFGLLPAPEPITPIGMKILGILLGLIYGWTLVGLLWPSLFGLLALALSGAMPIKDVFIAGFGSDTTILILFIFVFAALVEAAGVSKAIAMWLISRRIFIGKPWIFSFILIFSAYLLSATTSTIAAIIICWGIIYRISQQLGYKKGDQWPALMVFGVVFACTIGLSLFPFRSVPLVVVGSFTAISGGMTISFLNYLCFTAPIGILSLMLYIILCKFIFRPDITPLLNLTLEHLGEDAHIKLNTYQKIVIGFLGALILLLLLPSLLPKEWLLTQSLQTIGPSGTVLLLLAILVLMQKDGQPFINFKEMAAKGIQWDVVILTATVLPLIGLLTNDMTGIKAFLTNLLQPFFAGRPSVIFIALVILFAIILTNLCNNAVTGVILVAISYGFANQMQINTVMLTMLITFSVHLAVLTPAGSPMAAILHGNRQWISAGEIYRYGIITVLLTGLLLILVGLPLANFLF